MIMPHQPNTQQYLQQVPYEPCNIPATPVISMPAPIAYQHGYQPLQQNYSPAYYFPYVNGQQMNVPVQWPVFQQM